MGVCISACGAQQSTQTSTAPSAAESTSSFSQATGTPKESSAESSAPSESTSAGKSHILVANFSQAGEQYNVGVVEKGNTQIVAEMIAGETGADLFHIERKEAYPSTYNDLLSAAQDELKNNSRPELSASVDGWDNYDTIFLGYPIWWGDMPMPVYTFLESYDFSGKTVIPFDTNGGSGLADTVSAITKACPGATVKDGLAVSGKEAQTQQDKARSEVLNWLKGLP